MNNLKYLFKSINIGGISLKNRITMAPMFVGYGNLDGTVSERMIEHYKRIASGGVAMIVVEATLVALRGRGWPVQARIEHDSFIKGLSDLALVIKNSGSIATLQIHHAGRFARAIEPVAPSKVPFKLAPGVFITPRPMSIEEIRATIDAFAKAALRAKKAGFDMVELHGATGYLLTQFISPRTNKRDDEYGGNLEKRMNFILQIIRKIKELVGRDFPIGYRFLADEFLPDGFKIDEAKVFAKELEKAGIAYLSVTAGTYESFFLPEIIKMMKKKGSTVFLAKDIKKVVSIPVFGNGRIIEPKFADAIISADKVDAVALARPLFADPEFPKKAMVGEDKKIIKCVACNKCMELIMKMGKGAICSQWKKKDKP